MSDYKVDVKFTLAADSKEEATWLIARLLDDVISDPDVMVIHAQPARWVPQRPVPFAERYPGAA